MGKHKLKGSGRPFGSFKYSIDGKPCSIFEYRNYNRRLRQIERAKKLLSGEILSKEETNSVTLAKPKQNFSPIEQRVEQALVNFNLEQATNITKKDFTTLLLNRALSQIT